MTDEDNKQNEENGKENSPDKDPNLSPETLTLLDEEFWREATPQKVQELISRGANINAKNKNGLTAAHYAAMNGDISILKVLGENGADMNQMDNKAETPAHKVAKDEQSNDILKELAKYNANFDQTNVNGESPRDMIKKNQQDAESLLEEIDAIQQKKTERSMNDTLTEGSKEGEDDPRNEDKTSSKETGKQKKESPTGNLYTQRKQKDY